MAYKTLIRDMIGRGRLPMSESKTVREMLDRDEDGGRLSSGVVESSSIEHHSAEYDAIADSLAGTVDQDEAEDVAALEHHEQMEAKDETLDDRLAACVNLVQVSALREAEMEICQDEDERAYVNDLCDRREAAIREARAKK